MRRGANKVQKGEENKFEREKEGNNVTKDWEEIRSMKRGGQKSHRGRKDSPV